MAVSDPIDYGLPLEYREAVQKFMGYARTRGLYTASTKEVVAAIPKHDHYHFREDSSHRATLATVIAHRVRICAADHMFAKFRAKHLDALLRMYPYDKSDTRVFSMAYVFDKALYRAQHPAALKGRP